MLKRLLLATVAGVSVLAPASAATVVTAARMLDVTTGRYVDSPAIFIDDSGHITSIGDARTVRWGADVKQIDLGNRTVLPGLIDMHTHLADWGQTNNVAEPLLHSTQEIAYVGARNARATLRAGFTSVHDVGCFRAFSDVELRNAIARGDVEGPRMSVVGAHVRSASESVFETTCFSAALIQSANGSPARPGHAPAMTCQVRRP